MAKREYIIGVLTAFCAFSVINTLHYRRPVSCYDCFFPYGLPFAFLREDGFVGGGGIVWTGVLLDFLVVAAVGLSLGAALKRIMRHRSN